MNAATTPPDDDPLAQPVPDFDDWAAPPGGGGEAGAPIGEGGGDAIGDFIGDIVGETEGAAFATAGRRSTAATSSASEPQLRAWLEAIVEQDERALAALYDATIARVFGMVQRIVRDASLAEEVVEDAYFQVWRQALRFDPARGNAMTWLLSMARSRALDALRREGRFVHDALEDDRRPEATSTEPMPDELLELARLHADLHQALTRLGAQPRQLVSMSFFRGLTHEEIATQMGLPLGTVKTQIRRALLSLRTALGEGASRPLAS